jgi:hypothetical protein
MPVCPLDIEPNASLALNPGCGTLDARFAWWGTTPEGEEFVVLTETTQEVAAAIQNDGTAAEIIEGMYLRTVPVAGRYSFEYACIGASAEGSVTKQDDTYVGDIHLDLPQVQLDGTFTAVECEYLTVWPVDEGSEN